MGDSATNVVTEIQQEAMEVDGDSVEKVEDSSLNDSGNVLSVNGEESTEQSTPKFGTYQVKVVGLPKYYSIGEFKRMVKVDLGLALSYVRAPKKGTPLLHLAFYTSEEQHKAVTALHNLSWKKKVLNCSLLPTDAQKRKPEDSDGEDSEAKKARLDLTVEERVQKLTIPYHNMPYEEQNSGATARTNAAYFPLKRHLNPRTFVALNCHLLKETVCFAPVMVTASKPRCGRIIAVEEAILHSVECSSDSNTRRLEACHHLLTDVRVEKSTLPITVTLLKKKTGELKEMMVRLGELLVRRNPAIAGYMEQQKEKHDGLPIQLDEIKPSPVIEAYRNKCEFRVGLNPDTQERTVGVRLESYKDFTIGVGPAASLIHLPEQMREAVKLFEEYVRKSHYGPFLPEKSEGYWRHLVVRVTGNGDLMLVIVIHPQSLSEDELTKIKYDLKDYFTNKQGKLCNVSSLYFQLFSEK
ncbi:unnamed protein product [Timema podura]|uniref:RRM domain-containing protein n=1 Tax=Timema podura TaxID=61482 RepID=A0ABN7NKM3_TIMPD|nr:unnamed protein product [Timema podura]